MSKRDLIVYVSLTSLALTLSPIVGAATTVTNNSTVYVDQQVEVNGRKYSNTVNITGTPGKTVSSLVIVNGERVTKEVRMERREAFQEKLSQLQDERKREIVEKLDTHFARVNKKATDHFMAILDKLDDLLDRIESKSADTNTAAITEAQTAITDARAAVTTQAEKEYVITISTEGALRMDVGKVVSGLQADLQAVRKLVTDAKQAVMQAARSLVAQ